MNKRIERKMELFLWKYATYEKGLKIFILSNDWL